MNEIKLKKIESIKMESKDKNKTEDWDFINDFRVSVIDQDLIVEVNEFFYPNNVEKHDFLISCFFATLFLQGGTTKYTNEIADIINSNENQKWLFLYLLKSKNIKNDTEVNIFFNYLKEYGIESEFKNWIEKIFFSVNNKGGDGFLNFIEYTIPTIENNKKENLQVLFEQFRSSTLDFNNLVYSLPTIDTKDAQALKGNIFQAIAAKLLFNEKDNFFYNRKGGGKSGGLYPDLLYKYKDCLFICDSKCYKEDNIIPHKEFFYNIVIADKLDSKKEKCLNPIFGILFYYSKEGTDFYKINEVFKLENHYFYSISLNIVKIVEEYEAPNSLATLIAQNIISIHDGIKLLFKDNKEKHNEQIKLIEFKTKDIELEAFLGKNFKYNN